MREMIKFLFSDTVASFFLRDECGKESVSFFVSLWCVKNQGCYASGFYKRNLLTFWSEKGKWNNENETNKRNNEIPTDVGMGSGRFSSSTKPLHCIWIFVQISLHAFQSATFRYANGKINAILSLTCEHTFLCTFYGK